MRRTLFKNYTPLKDRLRTLRSEENRIIQIVQHEPGYVFPWPLLYDYRLPQKLEDAPICRGRGNGDACRHPDDETIVCVDGFWGVRHQVEQIMTFGTDASERVDAQTKLFRRGAGNLHLALGDDSGPTRRMTQALEEELTAEEIRHWSVDTNLLDTIWNEDTRPSLVVVLGHLETKEIAGEPPGPRIVLAPGRAWLRGTDIVEKEDFDGSMRGPRPLVLLLGCGSAAIGVETLNDMYSAFLSCGAVAAVGTESSAFADLASRFAERTVLGLWRHQTLGTTLRSFRRELLAQGNPLGFSFTAFGDAELGFQEPPARSAR
jgi:hypothetical protein